MPEEIDFLREKRDVTEEHAKFNIFKFGDLLNLCFQNIDTGIHNQIYDRRYFNGTVADLTSLCCKTHQFIVKLKDPKLVEDLDNKNKKMRSLNNDRIKNEGLNSAEPYRIPLRDTAELRDAIDDFYMALMDALNRCDLLIPTIKKGVKGAMEK